MFCFKKNMLLTIFSVLILFCSIDLALAAKAKGSKKATTPEKSLELVQEYVNTCNGDGVLEIIKPIEIFDNVSGRANKLAGITTLPPEQQAMAAEVKAAIVNDINYAVKSGIFSGGRCGDPSYADKLVLGNGSDLKNGLPKNAHFKVRNKGITKINNDTVKMSVDVSLDNFKEHDTYTVILGKKGDVWEVIDLDVINF